LIKLVKKRGVVKNNIFIKFLVISLCFISCKSSKNGVEIPKEKFYSFTVTFNVQVEKDSLIFVYKNPSYSPVRFYSNFDNKLHQQFLETNDLNEVLLNPLQNKTVKLKNDIFTKKDIKSLKRNILYGDITKQVDSLEPIDLPYPVGKTYSVLQGNNASFSHNTKESRYALDFKMNIGQEVSAVYDGVVVASIDKYTVGGRDKRLEPYGNYINIYHEKLGTYSTYFHLKPNGSIVKPGEKVKKNQIIGYSGHTGYSTEPHLHFVYYKPDKDIGLISIPFVFKNGTKSTDIKKFMKVAHIE